jgi:peptidylprolyl isomerase
LAKKKRRGGKTQPKKRPASNRNSVIAISLVALLVAAAVIYAAWPAPGLRIIDEVVGTGKSPVSGSQVTVNYVGTLENGTKFDSSYDRNAPYTFQIGAGRVIKGWDQGVMTMKEGGKRKLIIPPDLAYGEKGYGASIPPNATLIFEVELLKVE